MAQLQHRWSVTGPATEKERIDRACAALDVTPHGLWWRAMRELLERLEREGTVPPTQEQK